MDRTRIVDVIDAASFGLLPPCADPAFDHRTCDYWEDRDRGSKAHRTGWLEPTPGGGVHHGPGVPRPAPSNPFALPPTNGRPTRSPPRPRAGHANPFSLDDDEAADPNPFAPSRAARPGVPAGSPRKLGLLGRGLAVFGSYAKVLLLD